MNFFPAKLRKDNGKLMVDTNTFAVAIPAENAKAYQAYEGKNVVFGIRPEDIHDPIFTPTNIHTDIIEAQVDVTELMGNEIFLHMLSGQNAFVARVDPRSTCASEKKYKSPSIWIISIFSMLKPKRQFASQP